MHVLPALGARGAGNVRMREFVDCGDLRMARDDGVGIHLFELCAAMLEDSARNEFEAGGLRDGFGAPVRLEVADDDVDAFELKFLRLGQHLVGLADAGGVAEENLEFAPFFFFAHNGPFGLCALRRAVGRQAA